MVLLLLLVSNQQDRAEDVVGLISFKLKLLCDRRQRFLCVHV